MNICTKSRKKRWNRLLPGLKDLEFQVTSTLMRMETWESQIAMPRIKLKKRKESDPLLWNNKAKRPKKNQQQKLKAFQQIARNLMKFWESTQRWSTFQWETFSKNLTNFRVTWLLLIVTLKQRMKDCFGALKRMRFSEKEDLKFKFWESIEETELKSERGIWESIDFCLDCMTEFSKHNWMKFLFLWFLLCKIVDRLLTFINNRKIWSKRL